MGNNEKQEEQTNVAELKEQLDQEREAKLQAYADLDNYRKRMEREKKEVVQMSTMSIFRSIIDVIDDFERMIDDLEEKDKEDKIDAFKPILDKTKGILVDYSIVELDISEGDSFNHETMEAIGTTNVDNEDEHNRVKAIAQKGYKMSESDKIIRHAKVIVGKKQ